MKFDQTRYQIFITKQMTNLIMENLKISEMEALETFINSKIYLMIADPELDMWEHEIVTGDP